jgi:tRNA pseudouridine38-40 synthase
MRRYALHVPQKLEWLPIRDAADRLCGAHDFTSFTNARLKEKSAVRELQSLEFEWDGQCVDLVFSGTGFLHNMVRIMAGTLLEIGAGRMLPTDIPQMIAARDRKTAGPMLPAHALVLLDVQYD